jgi:hypothetical protein
MGASTSHNCLLQGWFYFYLFLTLVVIFVLRVVPSAHWCAYTLNWVTTEMSRDPVGSPPDGCVSVAGDCSSKFRTTYGETICWVAPSTEVSSLRNNTGFHTPVGNSDTLTQDFSVSLPTHDITYRRDGLQSACCHYLVYLLFYRHFETERAPWKLSLLVSLSVISTGTGYILGNKKSIPGRARSSPLAAASRPDSRCNQRHI